MKVQLIRNATMKITYGDKLFLTDPMLSKKGLIQSFAGIAPNPTVELSLPVSDIVSHIDAVLVSHNHPDHFDEAAIKELSKSGPVFCQPVDEEAIKNAAFENIIPVQDFYNFEKIKISRTGGKHGKGKILEMMGEVSGFVLQAEGEPTCYWIGDSILCEEVEDAITKFKPQVIITHSGGAKIPGYDAILMDGEQTLSVARLAPEAKVVAIHMESLDHCPVDRKTLRKMADEAEILSSRLIIPEDGEEILL